jgi:large subunit ribosomal protein L9
MKVILRKNFDQLGKMGEVVDVTPGYARNFLIPNDVAYMATPSAMRSLVEEQKQAGRRDMKAQLVAEQRALELAKQSVTIAMQVGEEERIFGAVTSQMIAEHLKNQGFDVDKRMIVLEEPIKTLGIYEVPVKLHSAVIAKVKVWVVSQ